MGLIALKEAFDRVRIKDAGDSLSSLIFKLIMDEIISKVEKRRGYKMGEQEIQIICYTDDTIIMKNNENSKKLNTR